MNVPGVVVVCKRSGIRIFVRCKHVNAYDSEYSKIDESGNIYEPGNISSSVNLVITTKICLLPSALLLRHFIVLSKRQDHSLLFLVVLKFPCCN